MTAGVLLPWVLLATYVILNAGLTVFGRMDYGIAQGASSRYRSMTFPFWFAVITVSALVVRRADTIRVVRPLRFAAFAVASFSLAVYGLFYEQGVKTIRDRSLMLRQGLSSVRDYRDVPDEALEPLYPDPSRVRMLARDLETYHVGPFAE